MTRSHDDIYDELLVIRCRRRDLNAWNELVGRWNDRLWYFLRRLISQEEDVGSVLQEVWLKALRGIDSLHDGTRLAPWLYTIAHRTAMSHHRSRYARREEPASELVASEPDETDDEQFRLDNVELVHFGLNQLGWAEREVLTLYFLDDLTIDEIADVLSIPAGTVKSRLFKARREMRRMLEREANRHGR